ncbi:MAG: hypothetical protein KAR21_02870 [Spirochaetales bacterium]|nr:hypothetical protein [Spirochaetales bacterium]
MNHVFTMLEPFKVPDGTLVSSFFNPMDSEYPLPFNLLDGFSIAGGRIEAGSRSKIQILPFVTQVTFVRRGTLEVRMKGMDDEEPYLLKVPADQAVFTRPGTFLQLINSDNNKHCDVLYIVSPGYLFLFDKVAGKVVYDDSVVLNEDWNDLRESGWHHSVELPTMEQRHEAYRILAVKDKF